jgi:Mlc titration factor MtfA (ptsG expression regulator)
MHALILIAVLCAGLALVYGLPAWRLQRVMRKPIDPAWQALLARNIPIYSRMSGELQHQLDKLVQQFLYQKKFVGCDGLVVDDEMRLTIAGQACLLLLNRFTRVYPDLDTILVYPSAFMVPRKQVDAAGVVTEARQDLLGESWGDGRVVLSWDHVQRGAHDWTDGQNVVLHEFAHQLDSESGSNNGAPYLGSETNYRNWSTVLSRDFANLRVDAMYRQQSVMDHYGATSPAEFFAVATETFFEKPWQMAARHGELFNELFKYYRVDPRAWQPQPEPELQYGQGYGHWQ